jgi:exosortase
VNSFSGSLLILGIATLTAFRSIWMPSFEASDPDAFEYWFFLPTRESGAVSLLVATWLLWNRRGRLAKLVPPRWSAWHLAAALVVVLLYVSAIVSGVHFQLAVALCLCVATLAGAAGGGAGLRAVGMPCLALLIAIPPPNPMLSEIVWQLQRATAVGAHAVLEASGLAIALEGTELRRGEYAFQVIEACSGWRGIQILSLVGLAASELRALPLRRAIWVVLAAWPVGIALNVARACLVVLSREEELDLDLFTTHTPQGIAVLLVGSVLLYAIAALVQPVSVARGLEAKEEGTVQPVPSNRVARSPQFLAFGVALSGTLAFLSFLLPLLGATPARPARDSLALPLEHASWTGTPLPVDYFFPYESSLHPQQHVEYRKTDERGRALLVDLFVARELPMGSGLNRIPGSKLLRPASDWSIDFREPTRIWDLGIEGEHGILTRNAGEEQVLVLTWRVHDSGLVVESLKSMFGPDACEAWGGPCGRVVARVAVPILRPGPRGQDRAMTTARRFLRDFEDVLDSLARSPSG